jgi:PncC family amidohydrolase
MWSGGVEARLLETLAERGETVATAESLTGGMLASLLTDVPGASRSFVGGVVSYATRVKVSVLGVPAEVVDRHGVVSRECAEAMALGVRERLDATWGLSTTGVAGPDEQDGRPVGTVWVGVAGPDGVGARLLGLDGGRTAIRQGACTAVLSDLVSLLDRDPRFAPGKNGPSGSVVPTTSPGPE